jgi:predicted Rossmann-fold nucleotide-binding protein
VSQIKVTSALKIKNICVFCGSSPGNENEFLESANHLGQILAERKIHLVYGGGSLGLIGSVSTAAFLGGNQVLGIVPKALAKRTSLEKRLERNYRSS